MNFRSQIKKISSAAELVKLEQPEQEFVKLPVEKFYPDPDQPRKNFEQSTLDSLQKKIDLQGQLQPIVVRPLREGEDKHKIISGERRWRAILQSDKVKTVSAVIRSEEMDEQLRDNLSELLGIEGERISDDMLTNSLQIEENNEREDTTCIENAESYKRMVDDLDGDKAMAAKALGMSPSNLSKFLSILSADDRVKALSDSNVCQDLNTLYITNNLLKVDEQRGAKLIDDWPRLVDSGRSMREVASEIMRDAKSDRKKAQASSKRIDKAKPKNQLEKRVLPKASSAVIVLHPKTYQLDLKVGSSELGFRLPKSVFENLKNQMIAIEGR
jgi:ParB family transcriptional regulator, chromosome partitioning protein